ALPISRNLAKRPARSPRQPDAGRQYRLAERRHGTDVIGGGIGANGLQRAHRHRRDAVARGGKILPEPARGPASGDAKGGLIAPDRAAKQFSARRNAAHGTSSACCALVCMPRRKPPEHLHWPVLVTAAIGLA